MIRYILLSFIYLQNGTTVIEQVSCVDCIW